MYKNLIHQCLREFIESRRLLISSAKEILIIKFRKKNSQNKKSLCKRLIYREIS